MDLRIWVIQHQAGGTSMRYRELACGYGDQRNKGSALYHHGWYRCTTYELPKSETWLIVNMSLKNLSTLQSPWPWKIPPCFSGSLSAAWEQCYLPIVPGCSYLRGWTIHALPRLNKVRKEPTGSGLPDCTVSVPLSRKAKHDACSPAHEITQFKEETRNTKSFFHFEACSCLFKAMQNSLGSVGNMNPTSYCCYWMHSNSTNIFLCHSSDLGSSPTALHRQLWNALPNPINYLASKGRLNLCDKRTDFI